MTEQNFEARLDGLDDSMIQLHGAVQDIQSLLTNQEAPPPPQHDKIFKALAKAQTEIQNAEMDATNPHYQSQYASLDSVLRAIREPLSKNGIAFIQLPGNKSTDKGEYLTLTTILAHESGQTIESYYEMYPPKQDPQGIGSAMTYMRRYAAMAICGIAGATDDDAESTKAEAATITAAEADAILNKADELFGADADNLLERMCDKLFMVDHVTKIPEGQADLAMRRLENQAKREGKASPEDKKPAKDKKKPEPDDVPADATPSA